METMQELVNLSDKAEGFLMEMEGLATVSKRNP